MSWSIEEHIGDFRPFPVQVVVYKGETGECLAYVSGEVADRLRAENDRLRELLAIVSDMARDYDGDRRLLRQLVQELYEDQCDECDQWKYRDRMYGLGVDV